MQDRAELITWLRGEIVGPSRPLSDPAIAEFTEGIFHDPVAMRRGPVAWRPEPDGALEEILYFERESPHRKYGCGLLHPRAAGELPPDQAALAEFDSIGADLEPSDIEDVADDLPDEDLPNETAATDFGEGFDVSSPDIRHPSTMGISFCVEDFESGELTVRLPRERRFPWQPPDSPPFQLNGTYRLRTRQWNDQGGATRESPIWCRVPAVPPNAEVVIRRADLDPGRCLRREIPAVDTSPIRLEIELYPRRVLGDQGYWLITLIIRNRSEAGEDMTLRQAVLYQTYFEVEVQHGRFRRYPESGRPFEQLDGEEQSLALLYRDSVNWAIGHGCAAGWDDLEGTTPRILYADVMPCVELPSMTPDIMDAHGNAIRLSMRELANLDEPGTGPGWQSLDRLADEYGDWIERRRTESHSLEHPLREVAFRHLDQCSTCLDRIRRGISLLRRDKRVLDSFRLTNLAMLLQQIATKQLPRRPLQWDAQRGAVFPHTSGSSPWTIYENQLENNNEIGTWRAFQVAFLLMSLQGVCEGTSEDREIVDLIWFPTGGGKTEAYLAVIAFYIFHERFLMPGGPPQFRRDGTNVLMRYTLRMLTTQQFQRAASLISAMEFLRRNPAQCGLPPIPGGRFSLGLWIGGDGSPNSIRDATSQVNEFRAGRLGGNPLVLTECPWCRAEIGRYDCQKPRNIQQGDWNDIRTRGITSINNEGPLLHCTDPNCAFGGPDFSNWLPIEVIDERIYKFPPSFVISTADKLAMIAYRPDAGALFGRKHADHGITQAYVPPGLIVQDELHLISGPLGTIYALYEGIVERLCAVERNGVLIKPKLIASTATIRGAAEQVRALYARSEIQLFPQPGLQMGDSFFGCYARGRDGLLAPGRLYMGIHANEYGSVLTTQVRAFSSALFRPYGFEPGRRDPWWTLLVFYNSIRELGGARTLFDSDIRSRLKFMFNREGYERDQRRTLRIVEELTSRLNQAEIVEMMNRLATDYHEGNSDILDTCLASNIIEVGVDIDRLSLMGVVGQPKTTATYIQVTGRIGRRWWERPGLVLMIYNPSKSRDRSHFEQFHSYHRRLYERVEPTSATPFALSAINRALPGALIAWTRQRLTAPVSDWNRHRVETMAGLQLLKNRCEAIQTPEDRVRSIAELDRVHAELERKWSIGPQHWEEFPPRPDGEYLMLWPGQFATLVQRQRGMVIPSSMRQVDASAELKIHQGYVNFPADNQ